MSFISERVVIPSSGGGGDIYYLAKVAGANIWNFEFDTQENMIVVGCSNRNSTSTKTAYTAKIQPDLTIDWEKENLNQQNNDTQYSADSLHLDTADNKLWVFSSGYRTSGITRIDYSTGTVENERSTMVGASDIAFNVSHSDATYTYVYGMLNGAAGHFSFRINKATYAISNVKLGQNYIWGVWGDTQLTNGNRVYSEYQGYVRHPSATYRFLANADTGGSSTPPVFAICNYPSPSSDFGVVVSGAGSPLVINAHRRAGSNAAEVWKKSYKVLLNGVWDAGSITGCAVDSQGNMYIVGSWGIWYASEQGMFVIKLDSNGDVLWGRRIKRGSTLMLPTKCFVNSSDTLVITGVEGTDNSSYLYTWNRARYYFNDSFIFRLPSELTAGTYGSYEINNLTVTASGFTPTVQTVSQAATYYDPPSITNQTGWFLTYTPTGVTVTSEEIT